MIFGSLRHSSPYNIQQYFPSPFLACECLERADVPGVFGTGKLFLSFLFFFWLGVQIVNQNGMLFVNQRMKSELILRTAIMGLNCSFRNVISVEKCPEGSATKGSCALSRLEKSSG